MFFADLKKIQLSKMVVQSNFIKKKNFLIVFLEIRWSFLNNLKPALGINPLFVVVLFYRNSKTKNNKNY